MPTGVKDKIVTDAIRRAVNRRAEGVEGYPRKLEIMVDALIDKACSGNLEAIKEVTDRLDGKPRQDNKNTLTYDATNEFREVLEYMWARQNAISDH